MLRPPIAQELVEPQKGGLVRIALKRAYADGTVAVDMDPLSLPCRLATAVRPPRYHTVKYAGVLAAASRWRSPIAPACPDAIGSTDKEQGPRAKAQGRISTVGRTSEEDVRNRRSRVPDLPGSHEAFGDGDRSQEHPSLPGEGRRADRTSGTLTQPRPSFLEERRSASEDARECRSRSLNRRSAPGTYPGAGARESRSAQGSQEGTTSTLRPLLHASFVCRPLVSRTRRNWRGSRASGSPLTFHVGSAIHFAHLATIAGDKKR